MLMRLGFDRFLLYYHTFGKLCLFTLVEFYLMNLKLQSAKEIEVVFENSINISQF